MWQGLRRSTALAALVALSGCARAPSPLYPCYEGSIGTPSKGVLTASAELPKSTGSLHWLTSGERHFGLPRFVSAIERAADRVAKSREGADLTVGDLSAKTGGQLLPHLSHRTGRDADLLLYLTTLEGAPVKTPTWIHIGNDGLGWDPDAKRFLRLDVEREWLLVKSLLEDDQARVQFMFVYKPVKALLIEWARARGEPADTIVRAMDVMIQPSPPAQNHDDHIHVRTACSAAEVAAGCEPIGPVRSWLAEKSAPSEPTKTEDLLQAILRPMDGKAIR